MAFLCIVTYFYIELSIIELWQTSRKNRTKIVKIYVFRLITVIWMFPCSALLFCKAKNVLCFLHEWGLHPSYATDNGGKNGGNVGGTMVMSPVCPQLCPQSCRKTKKRMQVLMQKMQPPVQRLQPWMKRLQVWSHRIQK